PLAPRENDEAVELARALTGANELNVVSYASEAGQFQQAGFPTAICGPGSIEQAHKANEFVALDQIERCAAFIRKLIPRLT
ncbi:MAG TPA: M20/M25/M40 family metallo-hydrolase, partial [Allosphingosinicella sp.]